MVFNKVILSDGTALSMSLQVLFLWSLNVAECNLG